MERGIGQVMSDPQGRAVRGRRLDWPFTGSIWMVGGVYLALVLAMVAADVRFTSPSHVAQALVTPGIRYAIKLSLVSCTISALLSLVVAVPLGYLLSRQEFRGKSLVDTVLDIPIVLPPLVIGLSLLILFQIKIGGQSIEEWFRLRLHFPVTYAIPSVILAQFAVAAAFAIRTMRV